jgi:hypothetical protein
MNDFMSFRRMVTPRLIRDLFIIAAGVTVLLSIGLIIAGFRSHDDSQVLLGFAVLIFGTLAVRVWCESMILFFQIHETLEEVADLLNDILNEAEAQSPEGRDRPVRRRHRRIDTV